MVSKKRKRHTEANSPRKRRHYGGSGTEGKHSILGTSVTNSCPDDPFILSEEPKSEEEPRSATIKVLTIYELVEMIVLRLRPEDILRCAFTKFVHDTIYDSPRIRAKLMYKPPLFALPPTAINPLLHRVFRTSLSSNANGFLINLFDEKVARMNASWRPMYLTTPGQPVHVRFLHIRVKNWDGPNRKYLFNGFWERIWAGGVTLDTLVRCAPQVEDARVAWEFMCEADTPWAQQHAQNWRNTLRKLRRKFRRHISFMDTVRIWVFVREMSS